MADLWHSQRGGGHLWNSGIWGTQITSTAGRLSISGSTILDPNGSPIFLRGINQGTWNENFEADAAAIKALGANCVRYVFRWWGLYGDADTDSRTENLSEDYIDPVNLAQMLEEVDWLIAQGLWVVFALDSNCGQNGNQDGSMAAYCDPGNLYPVLGRNFWSDLTQRELFKTVWRRVARELRDREYIACYEILPEPLEGRDSTYAEPVRDFYTEVRSAIRQSDTQTPVLVGPRDAYNILLSAEAYDAGIPDAIYTGNLLNGRVVNQDTLPLVTSVLKDVSTDNSVPILVQQVGRETINDTSLDAMRGVLSMLNSQRIHWTWWQYHQNTTDPDTYALYYKDGVGGWTAKPAELAAIEYYLTQNIEDLEADAIAAATAAGAHLFYIKSDLSNVFQDTAGTTPVTSVGQQLARINAVVGTGFFSQGTAGNRPLVATGMNRYAWSTDGTDDYIQYNNNTFFASGDDNFITYACTPGDVAALQVMYHVGTSGTNVRYPYLALGADGIPIVAWRGDDTVLRQVTGTTDCMLRPTVFSATMVGADKKLYVDGTQEGATNSSAVGSIASFTRMRFSANTSGGNGVVGTTGLACFSKTMTDGQRESIERFGAYLVGAAYRK